MGMTIDDIKHCLKVMVDCEVCEECNLYGTTGTDHCEHDCVCGALDIIDKYQKIVDIVSLNGEEFKQCGLKELKEILEVIADGTINSSDCV